MTKYIDGYIQTRPGGPSEVGYPEEWLKREVEESGKKKRIRETKEIERELQGPVPR